MFGTARALSRRALLHRGVQMIGGTVLLAAAGCQQLAGPAQQTPAGAQPQAGEKTQQPAAGSAQTKETVKVRFVMYNFEPWIKALNAMFQDFNKDHAGIQAEVMNVPEGWQQKIEAMATAGDPPELSVLEKPQLQSWAEKGFLQPVADYISRDKMDLSEFLEGPLRDGRFDLKQKRLTVGQQWALPATFVGFVVYINKNLLSKAGVAFPQESWTHEQMVEMAKKLTVDRNGKQAGDPGFAADTIAQYGYHGAVGQGYAETWIWAHGGSILNEDDTKCAMTRPESIRGLQFVHDLMWVHHVSPSPAQTQGQPDFFVGGRVAMMQTGTWNVDNYVTTIKDFDWDIVPVPIGPVGKRVTYAGTNLLGMYTSKVKDQAWEVLKFMVGERGMTYFAATGTPALKKVAFSDAYLKPGGQTRPPGRRYAAELGNYSRDWRPNRGGQEIIQKSQPELDPLWLNKISAEQAAKNVCAKIDEVLAEVLKDVK
jgi:multiple sugar transport system substrate-binding protein